MAWSTKPEDGEAVNGKWGHLLPEIPPGGNYLHYTAELGHPDPLFKWRSRYWTFLLKLDPIVRRQPSRASPGRTSARSTGRTGGSACRS